MSKEGLQNAGRRTATWAAPCAWAPTRRCWPATASSTPSTGDRISERHRHRYEVNIHYKSALEAGGLLFSGMSRTVPFPRS
jgi:hypothetical protein